MTTSPGSRPNQGIRPATRKATPRTSAMLPRTMRSFPISCIVTTGILALRWRPPQRRKGGRPSRRSVCRPPHRRTTGELQQLLLGRGRRHVGAAAEMRIRQRRRHPTLRGADEETFLDEERLVDVLDRVPLLADRRRERVEPDRTPRELVDDGEEERAVHLVEARFVDVEEPERVPGHGPVDPALRAHVGEVTYPAEEAVRDARRAARAAGDLDRALVLQPGPQDRRGAPQDAMQVLAAVEVETEGR